MPARRGSTPRYDGFVRAARLLLAALLGGGCHFDGGLGAGLLCPTGECPPGQICESGVCTIGGGAADAADMSDGARGGDAADDILDAGLSPNLVDNPGMEEGISPWTPFNAVLAESIDAHGGQSGLRVCAETSGDFTVYEDVLKAPDEQIPQGQAYVAEVWVRASIAGPAPPEMKLTIRESGGAMGRGDHDGAIVGGPGDQWVKLQAAGTVQESDRDNLILIVWGLGGLETACFAVDDAVLRAD